MDQLGFPDRPGFFWDERLFLRIDEIERSIRRQRLDSQGQFISITNAILMQLESGDPDRRVVRILSDALLALADARGLDRKKAKLDRRLDQLGEKLAESMRRFQELQST